MYEELVALCLEVYCEVVTSMICCLDARPSERLYEKCLSAIHMYAKYHSGKHRNSADPTLICNEKSYLLLNIVDITTKFKICISCVDVHKMFPNAYIV